MTAVFAALGRFDVRFRYLIVAVWVVGGIASVRLLPSLPAVNNFANLEFVPASSPSQQANRLAEPFQGPMASSSTLNPQTATLVADRASGPLTSADQAAIARAEDAARGVPGVSLVRDEGMSGDGGASQALVVVSASASQSESESDRIVRAIRAGAASAAAPGLRIHLTGPVATSVDAAAANTSSITRLTVLAVIVLLFLVYRALLAPLLTLIPAVLSLLLAEGLVAAAVQAGLLSGILINLLTVVLVGAATDYGLFLAFRFREELGRTADPHQALVATLARMGEVLTYSALTVVLSLLCLVLAPFGIYRSAGLAFAVGIGVLLAAALTLMPALLAIAGRAAFWPSIPRPGEPRPGLWGHVAERVARRPVLTIAAGLVVFAALSAGLVGYRIDVSTTSSASAAPPGSDSAAGNAVLAARFPRATVGSDQLLLRFGSPVWDDPAVVGQAQARLGADRAFAAVDGPIISADGRTVRFWAVLNAGPVGSAAATAAVPEARAALDSVARTVGAQASGLAGPDANFADIASVSATSTALVVPVVLTLILVLLAALLRSLVAPWYLALTVGLSYVASLGFAMIAFVHLGGAGGLLFALPLLMFVFTMAVGEDYNILVASRIREESARRAPFRNALVHAMGVTGGTVTSAGLILAGTFVVFGLVGGNAAAQQIGFGIAFAVILDTFFVRTLLVPSVAVLLGRWNWWPTP